MQLISLLFGKNISCQNCLAGENACWKKKNSLGKQEKGLCCPSSRCLSDGHIPTAIQRHCAPYFTDGKHIKYEVNLLCFKKDARICFFWSVRPASLGSLPVSALVDTVMYWLFAWILGPHLLESIVILCYTVFSLVKRTVMIESYYITAI